MPHGLDVIPFEEYFASFLSRQVPVIIDPPVDYKKPTNQSGEERFTLRHHKNGDVEVVEHTGGFGSRIAMCADPNCAREILWFYRNRWDGTLAGKTGTEMYDEVRHDD